MRLSLLLKGIDYKGALCSDIDIDSISHTYGQIKENSLYVLIKKPCNESASLKLDGIKPSVIVCEEGDFSDISDIPVITVKNAREALSFIYSNYYSLNYERLKVIGVTGTNGKTTTATLIKRIIEGCGKKVGFIGTGLISIGKDIVSDTDYSMTTPDPERLYGVLRAMCDLGCEYAVMEVSSHALALGKVAPIKFYRGVFTNLSPEHLDFHKSEEAYFEAKSRLFSNCALGIINIDDKYGKRLSELANCEKISCGIIENADICAFNIEMSGLSGSSYIYREDKFITPISIKLPGAFNIYNSLLAICTAVSLGIKPCEVRRTLSDIEEIYGRLNIIKKDVTVIIDYAHTSRALEECLGFLASSKVGKCTLSAVFGCGGERDRTKRPRMARAAQKYADKIIITSDNTRNESLSEIINDILSGFDDNAPYKIIEDRKAAILTAILEAHAGDMIVILGKGPEKYNITNAGYEEFDERHIVFEALNKRAERNIICE